MTGHEQTYKQSPSEHRQDEQGPSEWGGQSEKERDKREISQPDQKKTEPGEESITAFAAFFEQSNANYVRLEPGDDARTLLPYFDRLARVEIHFPSFRDGRGYSAAQILREAGFTGELRACGDILVDQIIFMKRCGFDSFAPDKLFDSAALEKAQAHWSHVYQSASGKSGSGSKSAPIWKLRHD